MKKNKFKHKYLRQFIKNNKIKDSYIKSGLYGAIFDLPKKINRALKKAKNKNHKDYLERLFTKAAIKFNSNNYLNILKKEINEFQ